MARHEMPWPGFLQGSEQGFIAQRPDGAGNLVRQQRPVTFATGGIGHRHGIHQLLGIRVPGILEDRAARPDLDDLAEIHHRHAMADPLDHRHVVRDEQEGEAEFLLQIEQ